jgi:L-alanine-DL-glutamate epimerase-like enolase superfamily enzyme
VHLAATIPNATLPSDILPFLRDGHIVHDPCEPKGGLLLVPEGPGLGIQLDDKMMEKYRVA